VACATIRAADWTGMSSVPCTTMVVPSINQLSREFLADMGPLRCYSFMRMPLFSHAPDPPTYNTADFHIIIVKGEKAIVRLKAKIPIQRKGLLIAVYIRCIRAVTRIRQEPFKNCFSISLK